MSGHSKWANIKRRKGAAFMMLTYAGSLVPFEFIITLVVRMLGFKSTYYLKGGKLLDTYPKGGKLHKWLFRKTINWQSLVMFEGEDSMNIVKEFATVPLVYFPNYIMDEQMRPYAEKAAEPVGILYFGRVTPEKNAHVILEVFNILAEKHSDMHLIIIGDSTRAINYTENIAKKIVASPYHDRITKLGNSPFEVLAEAMQKSHFFIFPSHEQAEGHSNSLTEAMSRGLVPIVSDWHFNRTIVGDDQLVVNGFNPEDYAKKIDEVIRSGNWSELSQKMYDRVCTRFRERVVLDNINEELKKISV